MWLVCCCSNQFYWVIYHDSYERKNLLYEILNKKYDLRCGCRDFYCSDSITDHYNHIEDSSW